MYLPRSYTKHVLRILVTGLFVCSNLVTCFAQVQALDGTNQKIRLEILVLSNNKELPDSTVIVVKGFSDSTSYSSSTSALFLIYLDYNDKYSVTVTKKNCNTKVLYLDTNCPVGNWQLKAQVNLMKGTTSIVRAGVLKYNAELQTFVKYAVK
jgi:hypothetical protein